MSGYVEIPEIYDEFLQDVAKIFLYRPTTSGPLSVMCARCGGKATVREPVTCPCGYLDELWEFLHRKSASQPKTYAEFRGWDNP